MRTPLRGQALIERLFDHTRCPKRTLPELDIDNLADIDALYAAENAAEQKDHDEDQRGDYR